MHRNPRPPPLAAWMLSRSLRGHRGEALLGDLAEEYRRGRSRMWYRRQALCAAAAEMREHPPRRFGLGVLRLLMILCVIIAATLHASWPLFIFVLDPSWLLLVRRHRRTTEGDGPCGA